MIATIQPGSIHGKVAAPPSKSMAQRAYAAALLHRGTTVVRNAGPSADEAAVKSRTEDCASERLGNTNAPSRAKDVRMTENCMWRLWTTQTH